MEFTIERVFTQHTRYDTQHLTFLPVFGDLLSKKKKKKLHIQSKTYYLKSLALRAQRQIILHSTLKVTLNRFLCALWSAFLPSSPSSSSFSSSASSSSPWLSEMELPLTFKDSSRKVIIELLPAVCRQEIGKWHMGPRTK